MRDEERLQLLMEVAGTRVYDERRAESLKIMEETATKTERIDEVLGYIQQRLSELEGEQKELAEFEKLDKKRRALEYAMYTRENAECVERVKELDDERSAENAKAAELHAKVERAHREVRDLERKLKATAHEMATKAKEKEAAAEERQELIRKRAKLELAVKDLEERHNREKERARKTEEELGTVDRQIAEAEAKLAAVAPLFAAKIAEEDAARQASAQAERRTEELYAKQGRSAQFKSKEERDKWLQRELKSVRETLEQRRRQQKELAVEAESLRERAAHEREQVEASDASMAERRRLIEQTKGALTDLRARRDELMGAKREQQRHAFEVDARAETVRHELHRCEKQLDATMSRVLGQGLAAVKRIVEERGITGVYGPVIDNFDSDAAVATALEVTAGNSLFHIIVDTDETATAVLEELNRLKLGRVTLMPLNRLAAPSGPELPDTAEVRPLIKQVKFEERLRPVFEHIFGKTLLCRSQEIAQKASREYRCNCVTLDGDQVNRKGVWTGGYYDPRASRLEAMRGIRRWRAEAKAAVAAKEKARAAVADLEQKIGQVLGELQKKETAFQQARDTFEQLVADTAQAGKDQQAHAELAEQRGRAAAQMATAVQQLAETERSMAAELGTDLLSQLTREEQAELRRLSEERTKLAPRLVQLAGERAELESRRNAVQAALATNLYKRRDELRELRGQLAVAAASAAEGASPVADSPLAQELAAAERAVADATKRALEAEQAGEEAQRQARELRDTAETLRAEERAAESEAAESARSLEQITGRRAAAVQRRDEAHKKLQSLGPPPGAAVAGEDAEARAKMTTKQLMRELQETSEALRAFGHVNKKARDQYVSFTEQRDQLNRRREELTQAKKSIDDLIGQLDQKKNEAISRTFKGVSQNFSRIFQKLAPGGEGSLVILRQAVPGTPDDGGGDDTAPSASQPPQAVQALTGVAVRVTFPGAAESRLMHQLSGGQKSLVALALIFAIQQTDPAPFFLFDEVDSNLDATYRESVARLVKDLSKKKKEEGAAQFIVTTFRPELVSHAKKWYGITYTNKVSTISPISREEALAIIREESVAAGGDAAGVSAPAAIEEPPDESDDEEEETKKRKKPSGEEEEEEEEEKPEEEKEKPTPKAKGKGKGKAMVKEDEEHSKPVEEEKVEEEPAPLSRRKK